MASSYLKTAGNRPEELDKLIQSFEFENQHIVKVIEKENQLLEALDKDILEKKDSMRELQESTTQLDEETKREHKLFIQNRDNCESLKKTASVLFDHEVALMKNLNSVVVTGGQERKDRKNVVQHYRAIWEDYTVKYESFSLAKKYAEKKHQLEESSAQLQKASQQIQKLKNDILAVKGSDINVYDMKKFVVALAEVKVDTENNNLAISGLAKEKDLLEMTLKGIHLRKVRAAAAAEEENKAVEEQRQRELLEAAKIKETAELRETGLQGDGNADRHSNNITSQRCAPTNTAPIGRQVPPTLAQQRPISNDQELSTLAYMCGSEQQGPGLSAQSQSMTLVQQQTVPGVSPVHRPPTPTPTAASQRHHANQQPVYQSRVNVAHPAPMKYTMNGVNRVASTCMPQRTAPPNYLIQPHSTQTTNITATSARQVLASRQLSQGRQPSAPTFKHPGQLESPISRVSPPRSNQNTSQPAHSGYNSNALQTQSISNTSVQNWNLNSQTERSKQTALSGPMGGLSAPPYLQQANARQQPQVHTQSGIRQQPQVHTQSGIRQQPQVHTQSGVRHLPQGHTQFGTRQLSQQEYTQPGNRQLSQGHTQPGNTRQTPQEHPQSANREPVQGYPQPGIRQLAQGHQAQTSQPQPAPISQGQVQISQQLPYTVQPARAVGNIPTSIPQTPARQTNVPPSESPQRTPEHQMRASPHPDGNMSPFDLEKHLERVRLLTKSPAGPGFITRPMFGSEQQDNQTAVVQETVQPVHVDENPFMQSFFPDGRGDGNLFQTNFSSPVLGETSDVRVGQPMGGMSFDFSGGGGNTHPGGMFALFGGPGETQTNSTKDSDTFSFSFGGSAVTSPPTSGFSLF